MSKKRNFTKASAESVDSLFTKRDRHLITKGDSLFGKNSWDESEPPDDDDDDECCCFRVSRRPKRL